MKTMKRMIERIGPQTRAALGVIVALALVAVLTARYDAPAKTDRYASTDYDAGGYRAWTTLLAREGITTARFLLRPIELDDRIDTLISAQPPPLAADPAARTAADIGALAAWVRAGGRLVYIGRNVLLADAETRLLQLPYFLPDVGGRGALGGPLAAPVGSLHALGTNRMLLVEHSGSAALSDDNGDIVVRYALGRGEVVAVIDPVPFANLNIASAGNARLAYELAVPRRPGGVVAFDDGLHGALIDRPWYRALPLGVRVTLSIVGVAMLLGLIARLLPGSPPMRLASAREPTSAEFVDALAALYERTAARAAARDILGREAVATAARSVGLPDDAPAGVLVARIGDRPGGAAVRRLLQVLADPVGSDSDLLASAKLAQLVRKEYHHGGNGDRLGTAFTGRSRTGRRR